MTRSIRLALLTLALAGCASAPPQGAVDEATKAVRANPELTRIFGEGYQATYEEERSVSSASLGTRVEFSCLGPNGGGEVHLQLGLREPWVAEHMDVTYHQRTALEKVDGAWRVRADAKGR